jgi:hypothetical protein
MGVSACSIVQGREQNALVEVSCRPWNRERAQQPQDAGAAADLGRAGSTTLDVGGQPRGICRAELIEQERIDERTGACAVQDGADVRVRHITYMTRQGQKVAIADRTSVKPARSAPQRLLRAHPELSRATAVRPDARRLDVDGRRRGRRFGLDPID